MVVWLTDCRRLRLTDPHSNRTVRSESADKIGQAYSESQLQQLLRRARVNLLRTIERRRWGIVGS